jgi:hypothetical protein
MAVDVEALQRRVEVLERELRRLARLIAAPEEDTIPHAGESIEDRLARRRGDKSRLPSLQEMRRAMGIPEDLEPMDPREVQKLMLSQGVDPGERLGSSEILRMREE